MGQSKQLLPFPTFSGEMKTIIECAVLEAIGSETGNVFVVLGAYFEEISKVLKDYPIEIIFNENWKNGMGDSIATAIRFIEKTADFDGVVLMLADQVYVSGRDVKEILKIHEKSGKSIVLSEYSSRKRKSGPPAFFNSTFFNDLKELDDDQGANQIANSNSRHLAFYDCPEGEVDIDDEFDYNEIINSL